MKLIRNIIKSKIGLFIGLGIIAMIIAIVLDIYDCDFSYHDILVEFHGLVFDLFVFGIILTVYETNKSKKEKEEFERKRKADLIERYTEEINDFKFWKSEEAMYRTRGLIKRLVKLGAKELNLNHCYLATDKTFTDYENMQNWKFSFANLRESWFLMSNMTNATFYNANLSSAIFEKVNLTNCSFNSSNLYKTEFKECDLTEVDFLNAIIHDIDWFQELERNNNIGVRELRENFKMSDEPSRITGKLTFRIEKR
ncbi:pentapeptide repeat-containing protein [Bizionia sp. KMM 8389]